MSDGVSLEPFVRRPLDREAASMACAHGEEKASYNHRRIDTPVEIVTPATGWKRPARHASCILSTACWALLMS